MEKISEAVLEKVNAEARHMIEEADKKAQEEIERAKTQRETKLREEKGRALEAAEAEAAAIVARASVKARQELSRRKADIIAKIVSGVEQNLSQISSDKSVPLGLVKEALDGLGGAKGRIYVSPKDVSPVQKLLEEDTELANRITEVRELDCTGGVVAEELEGKLRIDNTYETRLQMLLPKLLPEISKKLFEESG